MPRRKVVREYATAYFNGAQARSQAKETRSEEDCAFVLQAKEIRKCDTTMVEAITSYEEGACGCVTDLISFSKISNTAS